MLRACCDPRDVRYCNLFASLIRQVKGSHVWCLREASCKEISRGFLPLVMAARAEDRRRGDIIMVPNTRCTSAAEGKWLAAKVVDLSRPWYNVVNVSLLLRVAYCNYYSTPRR